MSKLARLLRPVLLAFALLAPLQAQAFQITVGGVTYELSTVNTSYDASATLLESQPWWSGTADATSANTFANAFVDAGGLVDSLSGFTATYMLFAAYQSSGRVRSVEVDGDGVAGGVVSSDFDWNVYYVTATVVPSGPAAVPEIDGNALPKALFLLFTLWLWLQVRRRKGQAHAKTA